MGRTFWSLLSGRCLSELRCSITDTLAAATSRLLGAASWLALVEHLLFVLCSAIHTTRSTGNFRALHGTCTQTSMKSPDKAGGAGRGRGRGRGAASGGGVPASGLLVLRRGKDGGRRDGSCCQEEEAEANRPSSHFTGGSTFPPSPLVKSFGPGANSRRCKSWREGAASS